MGASKLVKAAMKANGLKASDMAEKLDINAQSFSTKLYRDTWSYAEVERILEMLGYTIIAIPKDATDRMALR